MIYIVTRVGGSSYTVEADNFKVDGNTIMFYLDRHEQINVHLVFQTDIKMITVDTKVSE